jgi:Ca2+-transporting ATPase
MRRPPRDPQRRLLDVRLLGHGLLDGAAALAAALVVYLLAWQSGLSDALVAALTFASVVAGNVGLIAVNRSSDGLGGALRMANPAFWWICGLAALALGLALYVAPVGRFFHFSAPPPALLLAALLVPCAFLVALRVAFGRRARTTSSIR